REQVYLARANGSQLRPVAGAVSAPSQDAGAMSFSPDGRFLLVPRVLRTTGPAAYRPELLLADVARAQAHRLTASCGYSVSWSPHGRRVACAGTATSRVAVYDRAGRRRLSLAGASAAWSRAGLAVADRHGVTLLGEDGRRLHRYAGVFGAWSAD